MTTLDELQVSYAVRKIDLSDQLCELAEKRMQVNHTIMMDENETEDLENQAIYLSDQITRCYKEIYYLRDLQVVVAEIKLASLNQ